MTYLEIRAAYRITTTLGKYNSKWVVIRERDGKVMTEDHRVFVCCRWVKTWGESKL